MSNPTSKPSDASPIKIEAPKELPKVSLVNESLKKLKFHLATFDKVVKIRTTPDARTEGEWGFEHTKAVFNNEIIPFLKSLKDIFNVFNKDLLNEILEVQIVFDQMDAAVQQSSVDKQLKGKAIVDIAAQIPSANTIVPGMFKLDLEPLAPRLLQNRKAHIDYLKYTQEQANILQEIELLVYVRDTCPTAINLSAKKVAVTPTKQVKKVSRLHSQFGHPTGNKRNDRISQTPSRNMNNKVEAHPRKVNKKNCVVEPIRDVDVKHSLLKANTKPICATCKKSMFDSVHDMCLLDCVGNVNSHAKSGKKHKKQNIWKPTGHVFTEVGLKWKPTGRTFTIIGNSFPLTRITSANIVPPKKTTSHSVETQKPELKVYRRKPKNVKNIGSSKKAKTAESKNANHSEPNHTWGSNATDIPCSSSLVMTDCPDCSLVSGLRMLKTYDREPLSAHELYLRHKICTLISLDDMLNISDMSSIKASKGTRAGYGQSVVIHLNFACALGKSKKFSHQPKAEDTNQEKLYLLHMDFCGPMRVVSINGKSSGPGLHSMTPTTSSSGLVQNPVSQQPCIPPRDDWDRLFQPMFDEYFTLPSIAVTPVQDAVAPRAMVLADSPMSTSID
ncbi:hypothetical protein Tco_0007286 [Tanacetum coccineum]